MPIRMVTAISTMLLVMLAAPASAEARTHANGASRQWVARPPLQQARAGHSVEQVDGRIFAIGGFDDDGLILTTTESRRAGGAGVWHDVASMTPRTNLATAVVNGIIYAAGGYVGPEDPQLNVVETYNPRTDRWTSSRPLPQPRGSPAGASLDGLFYVAGGYIIPATGVDEQITASVLVYSPRTKAWTYVAPMPTAREKLRLVASGRYLYAIGGQDAQGQSLTTVERYNPKTNTWKTIAPLHDSRSVPGAVATSIAGHPVLAVAGGVEFDTDGGLVGPRRTTELLNIDTGRWNTLDVLLPFGRGSIGCALAADGSVLAIGGGTLVNGVIADVDALRLKRADLVR